MQLYINVHVCHYQHFKHAMYVGIRVCFSFLPFYGVVTSHPLALCTPKGVFQPNC